MPFQKDPQGVHREQEKYCSYCFRDGALCYPGEDLREFKKAMKKAILDRGESTYKAWLFTFLAGFAPRWKK
jgi:hypothetical protein